jgi:hypothetical protein
MDESTGERGVCDCGHPNAAHEPAARVGKAWFSPELAREHGRKADVWHFCESCEDGCYVTERGVECEDDDPSVPLSAAQEPTDGR